MERVIGIDLGTTFSCVAIVEHNKAMVIPNEGGYKVTPSMVAFTEEGQRLIGYLAKRQAVTNPTDTLYATKRLIGRRYDSPEVKKLLDVYPYEIFESNDGGVKVKGGGKEYRLPEVAAMILQEMRRVAEEHLGGDDIKKAVVTVPAHFSDSQRKATKDAGTIAGLDVIRIINEPTAAALAYGFGKDVEKRVAIYDLGGGTFDITIMEISSGVYEVLATQGDTYLGGEDIDMRIVNYMSEEFLKKEGIDLRKNKIAMQRLKDEAERIKCELSFVNEVQASLPFIISDDMGARHLDMMLTRQKLEELSSDLLERSIAICEATMHLAGLKRKDVEEVILSGGQTRMPKVQELVEQCFGRAPRKGVHPDEVVAIGAAIQGSALIDRRSDILLLDVTPLSLGIATVGGYFTRLIERNTTVPTGESHIFTTVADNQTTAKISVYQGESELVEENELLGEFLLSGIPKAPRGEAEIEVKFDIDTDGIVMVSAKDMQTGREQSITVTATSGLSEDEVQKLTEGAREFEITLKEDKELKRLSFRIDELADQLQNDLDSAGSKVDSAIREKILLAIEDGKKVKEEGDYRKLKEKVEELDRHFNTLKGITFRM